MVITPESSYLDSAVRSPNTVPDLQLPENAIFHAREYIPVYARAIYYDMDSICSYISNEVDPLSFICAWNGGN
jgi:hypothetical protein